MQVYEVLNRLEHDPLYRGCRIERIWGQGLMLPDGRTAGVIENPSRNGVIIQYGNYRVRAYQINVLPDAGYAGIGMEILP